MNNKLGINFEACFPDEERKALNEYLMGVSKAKLLKISSFFLGFNPEKSQYSDVAAFLHMFFSEGNSDFKETVFNNILKYVENVEYPLEMYEIPYVKSSLLLFEFIFDKIPEDQTTTKNKEEIERDIFKAYVALSQICITEYEKARRAFDEARETKLTWEEVMLANSFHNHDLINYRVEKVFSSQFLRAFYYFEFLSEREDCQVLLKTFYEHYGVKNYKEYLRRLLGITYPVLMMEREAHTEIHLDNTENAPFLNKHIIELDEEISQLDFIKVRSNPLYKFEENKYRIVYPLFVIEMIYNGLFFRLKAINENLDDNKVNGFYNLKTLEYSEQFVLSTLLREIYGKSYIQFSGEELDKIIAGAPDYYVRNGKYIHLYESKDILISKEIKQSEDFDVLRDELKLKLYENEKGKPKAIKQLVESVKKILSQEVPYDKNIKAKGLQIFPILILHYRMFNALGMNTVLNKLFKQELEKLEQKGFDISGVHSSVVIDVETLIFNREILQSKKIKLQDALLEYEKSYLSFDIKYVRARSYAELIQKSQNSLTPFSHYLDNKVGKLKLNRSIKNLLEKAYTLFEDDEN